MTDQATAMSAIRTAPAAQDSKTEPRIRVRGLAKRYGVLEVFRNIDFDVGEREILAIVGPSGCGKTTLLRCIDGLLPHDAGEIRVGATLLYDSDPDEEERETEGKMEEEPQPA